MQKYHGSIILSLLLLLHVGQLPGQQNRSISPEDLISFSTIKNLDLDAEHNRIIYELRETDLVANTQHKHLWLTDTEGKQNQQLTYSSKNEWDPQISPDGSHVAFFSDRFDAQGASKTRIWILPLNLGEAHPVSDPLHSISSFKWSSDGSSIYYLASEQKPDPTQAWEAQKTSSGFDAFDRTAEKPRMEIWQIDITDNAPQRLFIGDPGISSFDVDVSGDLLTYSTNYTGDANDWVETNIYLFSLRDSSVVKQLTDAKGAEEAPVFSPDGKFIAYQKPQDRKKPFSQLEIESIRLSDFKIRRLTRDLDLNVSRFHWYTNQTLIIEVMQGMNNHLYVLNLDGKTVSFSAGPTYFHHSSSKPSASTIAAVRQTPNGLGEIVVTQSPGRPWTQISSLSDVLADLTINPQTSFRWLSRDEKFNLQGLIVLPHFSGDEPLPLIVDIHGGPASRTDIALEQYAMFQAWASQGYAVFSPNFRGSEGYTAEFQIANYRDLGGGDYHDIMAGVTDLIRRGVAHPDSLVIMGGSYGGYMTNWAITQTQRFKAAVSRYGIYDLRSDFSNSIYAQWELDYMGKTYWDEPSLYRRLSPSTFIKRAKTPTLILHGADDENTFVSNSRELARALKTLDVPHRFFLYPREGHGMGEPAHRLDVFYRQLSWVNHHLGRQQALRGEDWLSQDIRVQVLSIEQNCHFMNEDGTRYLKVKLLLDGSRLRSVKHIGISDIRLEPGHFQVVGLPSGQFLAPVQDFQIDLGPDFPVVELELVFPQIEENKQHIKINGIGTYALPMQ